MQIQLFMFIKKLENQKQNYWTLQEGTGHSIFRFIIRSWFCHLSCSSTSLGKKTFFEKFFLTCEFWLSPPLQDLMDFVGSTKKGEEFKFVVNRPKLTQQHDSIQVQLKKCQKQERSRQQSTNARLTIYLFNGYCLLWDFVFQQKVVMFGTHEYPTNKVKLSCFLFIACLTFTIYLFCVVWLHVVLIAQWLYSK